MSIGFWVNLKFDSAELQGMSRAQLLWLCLTASLPACPPTVSTGGKPSGAICWREV